MPYHFDGIFFGFRLEASWIQKEQLKRVNCLKMKDITINFLLLRLVATSSKGFLFEKHDVLNSLTLVRKKGLGEGDFSVYPI